jgi:3-oxoacyl-[acyl-carrier protein] reductase
MPEPTPAAGRIVLIAGATGASGRAAASALLGAGARVVTVGSNRGRLDALARELPGTVPLLCDLTDAAAVAALATHVHETVGPLDGLIHLVGGWRGGGGLAGQSDDDWEFLEQSLTALRLTSRAFYDDLVASPAGRLAMVSSVSVEHPTAGGANYAALKAAAETWTRAVAQGFAKAGDTAAATIFVVRSLEGLEGELAARVVGLWDAPAAELNAARVPLSAG